MNNNRPYIPPQIGSDITERSRKVTPLEASELKAHIQKCRREFQNFLSLLRRLPRHKQAAIQTVLAEDLKRLAIKYTVNCAQHVVEPRWNRAVDAADEDAIRACIEEMHSLIV